nr:reverse transcriptase domain-containing protein [Tanacetum cinerariifolium]
MLGKDQISQDMDKPASDAALLGDKEKSMSAYSNELGCQSYHSSRRDTKSCYQNSRFRGTELPLRNVITKERQRTRMKLCQKSKVAQEDTESQGQKSKGQASGMMIYPSHRSKDPEDHLKIFQAAAKVERWAMPTWYHTFNSQLTGSARQKKCIKDPVEIYHINQKERESTEYFVRRFKVESMDMKGAPEIMRISGFMHGITNPELIKRLHDKILNLGLMNFGVVRSSFSYNEIIGRPGVKKIQAVRSTAHGMLKFPVAGGVLALRSNKVISIECTTVSGPERQPPAANQAIEERIKHVAEHQLNIREGCLLVRQKRKSQAADRNQAIQEEVKNSLMLAS